jgi:hypothetical protein
LYRLRHIDHSGDIDVDPAAWFLMQLTQLGSLMFLMPCRWMITTKIGS